MKTSILFMTVAALAATPLAGRAQTGQAGEHPRMTSPQCVPAGLTEILSTLGWKVEAKARCQVTHRLAEVVMSGVEKPVGRNHDLATFPQRPDQHEVLALGEIMQAQRRDTQHFMHEGNSRIVFIQPGHLLMGTGQVAKKFGGPPGRVLRRRLREFPVEKSLHLGDGGLESPRARILAQPVETVGGPWRDVGLLELQSIQ